jgi:hypothetical protein
MIDIIPDVPDGMHPDFCQKKHRQETEKVTEKETGQQKETNEDERVDFTFIYDDLAYKVIKESDD